jgi:hypothetical protein
MMDTIVWTIWPPNRIPDPNEPPPDGATCSTFCRSRTDSIFAPAGMSVPATTSAMSNTTCLLGSSLYWLELM